MPTLSDVRRVLDVGAAQRLATIEAPRRALFLDRDGVMNVDHGYVCSAEQTQWIPGIFELVAGANAKGFVCVVVTNQAGIGRGLYDEAQFIAHTRWLHAQFVDRGAPLLATFYCPHHPVAGVGEYLTTCACRKPEPGMLVAAAALFQVDLATSALIGDKPSDILAGERAGVGRNVLLEPGSGLPRFMDVQK